MLKKFLKVLKNFKRRDRTVQIVLYCCNSFYFFIRLHEIWITIVRVRYLNYQYSVWKYKCIWFFNLHQHVSGLLKFCRRSTHSWIGGVILTVTFFSETSSQKTKYFLTKQLIKMYQYKKIIVTIIFSNVKVRVITISATICYIY